MSNFVLAVVYPMTGITQLQEHNSMHEAIAAAHAHFAAFPQGVAQLRDGEEHVVMANEELRALFRPTQQNQPKEEPGAGRTSGGFLPWLLHKPQLA